MVYVNGQSLGDFCVLGVDGLFVVMFDGCSVFNLVVCYSVDYFVMFGGVVFVSQFYGFNINLGGNLRDVVVNVVGMCVYVVFGGGVDELGCYCCVIVDVMDGSYIGFLSGGVVYLNNVEVI